jgi:hypothetical protein
MLRILIRASQKRFMKANDLTRPLNPAPRKQRRGIVLPIVAGTLCGVLSGLAILFGIGLDRGEQLSATRALQPLAESVAPQAAPSPPHEMAVPSPKTITVTVIDSQTGAKREVVLPAATNDQSEGDLSLRSTATITPVESVAPRRAPKSKRH